MGRPRQASPAYNIDKKAWEETSRRTLAKILSRSRCLLVFIGIVLLTLWPFCCRAYGAAAHLPHAG